MYSVLKNFGNVKWFRGHLYAYKNLLRRRVDIILKRPFLYNCELFFDTACNLRCEHCSISNFQQQPNYKRRMSLSEIEHVAGEMRKFHCFTCCLVGGELLIRKDLPQIVSIFHNNQILPTLITNGYFITEEKLTELKKAGLFSIGVSLNGITPETNDSFVNKSGALSKQLDSIDMALKLGINTSIAVVPTHQNIKNGEYRRIIEFAVKKAVRVNVNYPALAGQYTACYDELLTKEELKEVREYFKLPNVTSDFTVMGGIYECPAGRKKIYILPDGSICPCTFIHISFGNILKEPLSEIMSRIWATRIFMSRPKICLTGESKEFNEKYLGPVFDSKSVPLDYRDHPLYKKGDL